MGGHPSKYNATALQSAKGHCTETILGHEATLPAAAKFTIRKQSPLNKREFYVTDGNTQQPLFQTKAVAGTNRWFDLVDANDKPLLRVARITTSAWEVFRIDERVWEGQQCDTATNKTTNNAKLYRLGQFKVSGTLENFYLYNKENGDLHTTKSLLRIEKIRSFKQKWQTLSGNALIGYWDWSGSNTMHLQPAAGIDLALHVIATVMTHLITVDQQAAAGAVAGC